MSHRTGRYRRLYAIISAFLKNLPGSGFENGYRRELSFGGERKDAFNVRGDVQVREKVGNNARQLPLSASAASVRHLVRHRYAKLPPGLFPAALEYDLSIEQKSVLIEYRALENRFHIHWIPICGIIKIRFDAAILPCEIYFLPRILPYHLPRSARWRISRSRLLTHWLYFMTGMLLSTGSIEKLSFFITTSTLQMFFRCLIVKR